MKPAWARRAARYPLCDAQPGWKRFVQAPSEKNSRRPAAWLAAMPNACASSREDSPSSFAVTAAAANGPMTPVG